MIRILSLLLGLFGVQLGWCDGPRVVVTSSFLDLRTGPGQGFPVIYSANKDQQLVIVKRRTDWFKVETQSANQQIIQGWVHLDSLKQVSWLEADLQSVAWQNLADFQQRDFEFILGTGLYANEFFVSFTGGYRLNEFFILEASFTEVSGDTLSADLIAVNLLATPGFTGRWQPFFTLGTGQQFVDESATLVNQTIAEQSTEEDSTLFNAGVGMTYYWNRQFIVRAAFKQYTLVGDENRLDDHTEYSFAVGFFF